MKITYWEVRSATDEYRSQVIARYSDERIAKAIAKMGQGWYGSPNTAGSVTVEIDDTTDLETAKKNYLRNTPEYKRYLDAKNVVESLERKFGAL